MDKPPDLQIPLFNKTLHRTSKSIYVTLMISNHMNEIAVNETGNWNKTRWSYRSRKPGFFCFIPFLFSFIFTQCAGANLVQPKNEITISFTGDILMGSFIGNYIDKNDVNYPWNDVAPILNKSDLSVANLETSVSNQGITFKPPGYGFRSNPGTLHGLTNAGIRFVSIANNHTLDFGEAAFIDTMDYLKKNKIGYTGGGMNREEAQKPHILKKNGITSAFISYSQIIPDPGWIASKSRPGISALEMNRLPETLEYIHSLSKKYDLVFVILHWGVEHTRIPEQWQTNLAHKMIDSGAAGIIGHHPHVLQPIEFYKNKPVIYSLGNFVFLVFNQDSSETGIFEMTFDRRGFKKGFFYPVFINYCKANLLNPEQTHGKRIISTLNELSLPFGARVTPSGQIMAK